MSAGSPSRVVRGLGLVGNWCRHLATTDDIRTAGRDLVTWTATTVFGRDLLRAGIPWLPFAATRWLEATLSRTMSVFEWGAGGSTLFLAPRVGRLESIEYDPQWHSAVAARLAGAGLANVRLRLVPPRESDGAPGDAAFRSSAAAYAGYSFEAYVNSIGEHPPDAFDLIVVDGRARNACVRAAIPRLKTGGFLLLDDSDRADTAESVERLERDGWTLLHFRGPGPRSISPAFWRCTAALKPAPGG